MRKFWYKFKRFFNTTFRGWKYTNVEGFTKARRAKSKKEIIKEIVEVASKITGKPPIVADAYIKELRNHGKRKLIKTLTVLSVAYTNKLLGGKKNAHNNKSRRK